MPVIANTTDPNTLKKYEGKDFVRRVCQPIQRQQAQKCDYCPAPIAGQAFEDNCDIYMCNVCDTEACNSWGTSSMPDQRQYSSGFKNKLSLALLPLLLVISLN